MPVPALPLTALRAFDAAARHLSFTKAAEELGVTQAAVSSQIRSLEESLAARLFVRKARAVTLTGKGARLHRNTRSVFAQLSAAVADISRDAHDPLVIALTPSFAARWLFPRMSEYRKLFPNTDLRLSASIELHDFVGSEVDLAIRWGKGNWRGLSAEFLLDAPLTPVCSPRLVKELGGLAAPLDLARYPLLHERDTYDWRMWLKTADAEKVNAERGPVFDNPSLVDSAAIGGEGVAMGRPALLGHMLDEGLLVQPFDIYFRTPSAYYLVYREGALGDPKIRRFRDFLMDGMGRGNGREIS